MMSSSVRQGLYVCTYVHAYVRFVQTPSRLRTFLSYCTYSIVSRQNNHTTIHHRRRDNNKIIPFRSPSFCARSPAEYRNGDTRDFATCTVPVGSADSPLSETVGHIFVLFWEVHRSFVISLRTSHHVVCRPFETVPCWRCKHFF